MALLHGQYVPDGTPGSTSIKAGVFKGSLPGTTIGRSSSTVLIGTAGNAAPKANTATLNKIGTEMQSLIKEIQDRKAYGLDAIGKTEQLKAEQLLSEQMEAYRRERGSIARQARANLGNIIGAAAGGGVLRSSLVTSAVQSGASTLKREMGAINTQQGFSQASFNLSKEAILQSAEVRQREEKMRQLGLLSTQYGQTANTIAVNQTNDMVKQQIAQINTQKSQIETLQKQLATSTAQAKAALAQQQTQFQTLAGQQFNFGV